MRSFCVIFLSRTPQSGQLLQDVGGTRRGAGPGESLHCHAHRRQRLGIALQTCHFAIQPLARHLLIFHQPRGAGFHQRLRIAQLMIIGREGKGNQDRRPPRRR